MSTKESNREAALIAEAEASPLIKRLGIFTKLSGPGWLQGAITLGYRVEALIGGPDTRPLQVPTQLMTRRDKPIDVQ